MRFRPILLSLLCLGCLLLACGGPSGPDENNDNDAGIHCKNRCEAQAKRCQGAGYQRCERRNTGCRDWGVIVPCESDERCQAGQCVAQCSKLCAVGEERCRGDALQQCQSIGQGCTGWSAPTDCPAGQACRAGKCAPASAGCRSNADCKDKNKPSCDTQNGQCVPASSGCQSDTDCKVPTPRCHQHRCVADTPVCGSDADCKDPAKPRCRNGTCQAKSPGSCTTGCGTGQFCFNNERCLPDFKACQSNDDCESSQECMDAGDDSFCLPKCNPTKNQSADDLRNPTCWATFGECYSIDDNDKTLGACYPPQREIRAWKEQCNDEGQPSKASYHLCRSGLQCIEADDKKEYCWRPCDPKKNVGGDPDAADKNPDCEGGKGTCYPLQDGGGACEPVSGNPTPGAVSPTKGILVINEVLADPPDGNAGDANKDGQRSSTADEFIELVNTSAKRLTLQDVTLQDSAGKRLFGFSAKSVLAPKQAIVLFGGGMAQDAQVNTHKPHKSFSGALVYNNKGSTPPTRGLSLTNKGKSIKLLHKQTVLDTFVYGSRSCDGNQNRSLTRTPELTGTCTAHPPLNKRLYSPGTRGDGTKF